MNSKSAKEISKIISASVTLPKTDFPLRAVLNGRDQKYSKSCSTDVYKWQYENRVLKNQPVFTLHDGPPYANGDLHMGHFLNRVCKDFIIRYKLLQGYGIDYHLGWDCHGLPIEQKALMKYNDVERDQLDPMKIRKTARSFALKTVDKHVKEVQKWELFYDWSENSYSEKYLTLNKEFEANEIDIFRSLVRDGYVYKGYKPIYWSPASRTALADSEIEYNDNHKSTAIYVSFTLNHSNNKQLEELIQTHKEVQAIIYTTTPWTIPSNVAISVNPEYQYYILQDTMNMNRCYIVEASLSQKVMSLLNVSYNHLFTLTGKDLLFTEYLHPLFHSRHPIITGYHVTQDVGTGMVHTSPAHGEDDFNVCKSFDMIRLGDHEDKAPTVTTSPNQLSSGVSYMYDIVNDVDAKGNFTNIFGNSYEGKNVLNEGNSYVIDLLSNSNHLMHKQTITHRYPYDWRAKTPVINRCTEQFFVKIDEQSKKTIINDLENVSFYPKASRNRLVAMIQNRPDWCISRQRRWGVPVPIFYIHDRMNSSKKDIPIFDDTVLEDIEKLIRKEGSDAWYKYTDEELTSKIPSLSRYLSPSTCLTKSLDTLDVWFDSGSTWKTVLPTGQADVYFEGSDQHRGWFQSSAILSSLYKTSHHHHTIATRNTAVQSMGDETNEKQSSLPFKTIITHGFINDEKGRKMSKSLGNTILPQELIETGIKVNNKKEVFGADITRLFASSCNYTNDFNVGALQLTKVSEVYRRLRNTCRFMLGNIQDFNTSLCVPYQDLSFIDKNALNKYYKAYTTILENYENYEFYNVYSCLSSFIVKDLSSGYFDIIKDRLYTDPIQSPLRLSAQTTLYNIMDQFPLLFSPLVPFLGQEIYEQIPSNKKYSSIFMNTYHTLPKEWKNSTIETQSNVLNTIKQEANKLYETLIQEKIIKTGLESDIHILLEGNKPLIQSLNEISTRDYEDLFLCSHSSLSDHFETQSVLKETTFSIPEQDLNCHLFINKSTHHRCDRCWKYNVNCDTKHIQSSDNKDFYFCDKCYDVLKQKHILE